MRPPRPTRQLRDRLWGTPDYTIANNRAVAGGRWERENLCEVTVSIGGVAQRHRIHRAVHPHFVGLVHAWHEAGVWDLVLTLDRVYELDHFRGFLRAHAHGSAFDINLAWNPNGKPGAVGKGTVLPLLEIARSRGWWCGADWTTPAAKHFELTRVTE